MIELDAQGRVKWRLEKSCRSNMIVTFLTTFNLHILNRDFSNQILSRRTLQHLLVAPGVHTQLMIQRKKIEANPYANEASQKTAANIPYRCNYKREKKSINIPTSVSAILALHTTSTLHPSISLLTECPLAYRELDRHQLEHRLSASRHPCLRGIA